MRVFANVYNLLDEICVRDTVDNSSFNSFDNDHDADDAEVFLGIPRILNVGVELTIQVRRRATAGSDRAAGAPGCPAAAWFGLSRYTCSGSVPVGAISPVAKSRTRSSGRRDRGG